MFILERTVDPTDEPVTLTDIKRQVRAFASVTDEDGDFIALGKSAREWAEDYAGRSLMAQSWRLTVENVAWDMALGLTPGYVRPGMYGYYQGTFWMPRNGEIMLRRTPVVAITKFVSVDALGAETAVPTAQYSLREKDSKWPRVVPLSGANWSVGMYRIEFDAGYVDEDAIPIRFKQAIRLHAEAHYDRDPGVMKTLLEAAENLLKPECSNLRMA